MKERSVYGRPMQFRVLGPLEVDAGDGPIPLGGPKQRAVLANLLVRANQVVPAETLIDEVWGEEPPEKARNTLQTYVSNLRKTLGDERLMGRPPGYVLRLDPFELDASRFDALVRDAKKALPIDPHVAVTTLDDALALWRGPALADIADRSSLVAEAARLDDLRLEAQEDRVEGLLAGGAQTRAIGELEGMVTRHPLRESLWGLLMLAFYREGRQAEALGAFQRAREILADELGIDPSPELARLHERVLKQDPGLDLRGEPLRGYRLLEKIDDGPTGSIFRAIQPHVGRDVAIKLFHERIADDPAFVRRFDPQAQAVAGLEHPHIVPIYDYWREPGRAYVVSRYLRGGSLRGLEDRGESLDRDRALRIIEQVASGIAFAHRQGIAHGAVAPSDILFDPEGNAYLGGFPIGVGGAPDPSQDVRELARLASELLGQSVTEPLDGSIQRAESRVDAPDADEFAQAARAALEPTRRQPPKAADERNPYKGLRAFGEADARDFFGRGALVQRLVARLKEPVTGSRFVAVVGASGGGKSSVVRAGLVPALRQGALDESRDLFVTEMFPGPHPIEELEAALLRVAVRPVSRMHDRLEAGSRGLLEVVDLVAPEGAEVLLVVDQFEEAFTLTTDEHERELFLESLRVATADPESRLRVVVTLRADFYDRPLVYPRFGDLLAARSEAVPPLSPDELEQAIRAPAEQAGASYEPGLVAEMIADVVHQPGALPLLQYALTELFERREGDLLTLRAYQEIGGIAGALSARADRIVEATDAAGRRAVRQVFLRLVTLGEGMPDTRRRVARNELDSLEVEPEAVEWVLDAFGRHRLLTFDREPATREPTVEIAHEALLTAWKRLRTWIDDARGDLRQNQGLARAAVEWRGSSRDPSFLIRGARLDHIEAWAAATTLAIGQLDRAYLKASVDHRDQEREAERERRKHEVSIERRSQLRLRALVAVFAVAALIAGSLTLVATSQSERAGREARIATARELAAASIASLDDDPERGILLAIEAVKTTRSADGTVLQEAEQALHQAVAASRTVMSVPGVGGAVSWSPAGVFVTEGPEGSGVVDVRDDSTGEAVREFQAHDGDINDVAFSPDGSMLATTGDDGELNVWDPSTGELLASVSGEGEVWGASFSADGTVAASWPGEGIVRVMDAFTDRVIKTLRIPFADWGGDTSVSPDGSAIAVTSGAVVVIDIESGKELFPPLQPVARSGSDYPVNQVAWSPDGRSIATASVTGNGDVWDAKTGSLRFTLAGHTGFVESVAWAPDFRGLVTGGSDGTARVWQIRDGAASQTLILSAREMAGGVRGVAFSSDGTRVLAGGADGAGAKIWDVGPDGDAEVASFPGVGFLGDVEFMPDGRRVVAARPNGSLTIWDLEGHRSLGTIGPRVREHWFDLTRDGSAIAIFDETVTAWNTETGDKLFAAEVPDGEFDWSPDGQHLVVANTIVDRTGREVGVLEKEGFDVREPRFSPDGRLIATTGDGPTGEQVVIWDWKRGSVVRTIDATGFDAVFDHTGSRIATDGAKDGTEGSPAIWDVETGAPLVMLRGHSGPVFDVDFSPDGSRVATGGVDGTVRVFDAGSGEELLVLRGHESAIRTVNFSPDGTMLASQSPGEVRIWALDIDGLLEIARHEVTRALTDEECRQYLHVQVCPATNG